MINTKQYKNKKCSLGNPTLKMITKVWQSVKRLTGYKGVTEYSTLWHNKYLQELLVVGKIKEWEKQGIRRLAQLYEGNAL